MIYILARDIEDAKQWCLFNGVARADSVYLGQARSVEGRVMRETDRIVRTARRLEHPAAEDIEHQLARTLAKTGLTETLHGRLVRRES